MRRIVLLSAVLCLAAGCTMTKPTQGRITAIAPGEERPGFEFVDVTGMEHEFDDILGDYTLVAFTHSEPMDMTSGPSQIINQIIDENRGNIGVDFVVVCVHPAPEKLSGTNTCDLLTKKNNVVALTDSGNQVRESFGIGTQDWVVVIGPDKKIQMSLPLNQVDRIRDQLGNRLYTLSEQRTRAY